MKKLSFDVEASYMTGSVNDAAYPGPDEALSEALAVAVMQSIGTDLEVTVGGVTMFLAAWEDPEHWATDWAEKLGVEHADAPAAVAAILASAVEED